MLDGYKKCESCKDEFKARLNQRYCSNKCAQHGKVNSSKGTIACENSEGKIIFRKKFVFKGELRQLLEDFKNVHCIIIKFN